MIPFEASLFRLFRRSRYAFDALDEEDGGGCVGTGVRSERERFAAAAVAFCLKHSNSFSARFWRTICRSKSDPSTTPELEVALEPANWADVMLTATVAARCIVFVIEFKVDSDLAHKQDPSKVEAFLQPDVGYGALFTRYADRHPVKPELRYIVLGSRKLSTGSGETGVGKIAWQARRWMDMLQDRHPTDSLTDDLFQSLGDLGISSFRMKETKKTIVAGDFSAAASAWEVLKALGSSDLCDFKRRKWQLEVDTPVKSHFNVGAYLRRAPDKKASSLHRRLSQRLSPTGKHLLWAGYETGPSLSGGFCRSVWFYCGSVAIAKSVARKLRSLAQIEDRGDGPECVVAVSLSSSTLTDLEWFHSVLKVVAK